MNTYVHKKAPGFLRRLSTKFLIKCFYGAWEAMRNEGNYSGKDRDQLQGTAEINQVSHDSLQKGRWNVKKFKEKKTTKTPEVTWTLNWSLLLRTLPWSDCISMKASSQSSVEVKKTPITHWNLLWREAQRIVQASPWMLNATCNSVPPTKRSTEMEEKCRKAQWRHQNSENLYFRSHEQKRTGQKFIKVIACWRILRE